VIALFIKYRHIYFIPNYRDKTITLSYYEIFLKNIHIPTLTVLKSLGLANVKLQVLLKPSVSSILTKTEGLQQVPLGKDKKRPSIKIHTIYTLEEKPF